MSLTKSFSRLELLFGRSIISSKQGIKYESVLISIGKFNTNKNKAASAYKSQLAQFFSCNQAYQRSDLYLAKIKKTRVR